MINTLGRDTTQRKNDWILSNDLKWISPDKLIYKVSRLYYTFPGFAKQFSMLFMRRISGLFQGMYSQIFYMLYGSIKVTVIVKVDSNLTSK